MFFQALSIGTCGEPYFEVAIIRIISAGSDCAKLVSDIFVDQFDELMVCSCRFSMTYVYSSNNSIGSDKTEFI